VEPWKLEPAHDHGLPPAERARSLNRESSLLDTLGHAAWTLGVKSYLRLYHRLSIEGAQHIPRKPPFILIANHASHLDALILAAALPTSLCDRVFPVAAGDVFFHTDPISIFAAGFINALPMWRKNCGPHALAQLRDRLVSEPCIYLLFPEGARSRDGRLLKFKAGLGMLIGQSNVPVVPCALIGAFQAMPPMATIPRPRRIRLRIGPPITFPALAEGREGWNLVATRTQSAVESLLGLQPATPASQDPASTVDATDDAPAT
jgi:1-acyl-sn-glycerol-3-phosphate acyltransferase